MNVEITDNSSIAEKRMEPSTRPFPFGEQALLAELNEKSAHADLVTDPIAEEIPE